MIFLRKVRYAFLIVPFCFVFSVYTLPTEDVLYTQTEHAQKESPEVVQWLLYMDPAIGLSYCYVTANCCLFNSSTVVNRVCHTSVPTAEEICLITAIFGEYPFMWAVHVTDTASIEVLVQNDLKYRVTWPVLKMNLDTVSTGTFDPEVSAIEIDPNERDGACWASIVSQAFKMAEPDVVKLLTLLSERIVPPNMKLYLGYYNQTAVAAGMAIRHGDTVSLHWIGTVPAYRNKGLGTAITHRALTAAQASGCKQAVLFASASGRHMYERLGFEECDAYAMYSKY